MFFAGYLPEIRDEHSESLREGISDNFFTKDPQVAVLNVGRQHYDDDTAEPNHHVFVPLKTDPTLEVSGQRLFWVNTTFPEYIYTDRVGVDVMTWTERGSFRCLYAGQLYEKKNNKTGLRFVLKVLRGKCKDSKIHLLVAYYDKGEWKVRYIRKSDAHKDFLAENQPTPYFASPELMLKLHTTYHEQTTALYRAFDKMGGTKNGAHYDDYRVGRNYQLSEKQLDDLLNKAFPEESDVERTKGLEKADLISFTLIAPHQPDCSTATRILEHQKGNTQFSIHPSEGT